MVKAILISLLAGSLFAAQDDLESARDRQDLPALEKMIAGLSAAAGNAPGDAAAQYRVALASSYLAEVALEVRDKAQAKRAAENGIRFAERAVSLKPDNAEHYRVLGTLCGQVIPANVLAGFSYGKRAREAVEKAIERDPKSARAWLARGVGNYYLPAAFGGGPDAAIQDFQKAIQCDPKSADSYMWLGLSLRKLNRNKEAREALTKSLTLNPRRVWTKQQLEKTPVQ